MAGSSCELSGHGAWPVLQVSEISLACDRSVDYGFGLVSFIEIIPRLNGNNMGMRIAKHPNVLCLFGMKLVS